MNALYKELGGNNPVGNLQNALLQIKQNPMAILRQAGLNIPQGMGNPQQIVNYLVNSGQINQQRLSNAQRMAAQIRR